MRYLYLIRLHYYWYWINELRWKAIKEKCDIKLAKSLKLNSFYEWERQRATETELFINLIKDLQSVCVRFNNKQIIQFLCCDCGFFILHRFTCWIYLISHDSWQYLMLCVSLCIKDWIMLLVMAWQHIAHSNWKKQNKSLFIISALFNIYCLLKTQNI